MYNINGFDNEYEFVKYLNGKRIMELNPMFEELIKYLFPNARDDSMIKSWRNHYKQKTDVFIKVNEIMKGISIKKGMKNSVHTEYLVDFISFLKENNVSKRIIDSYLKYHYADGSIDGSGTKRISVNEYKVDNQCSIDEINEFFNQREMLLKAIDRFVIKGTNSNYYIDALIWVK